jgi:hypothetical protein
MKSQIYTILAVSLFFCFSSHAFAEHMECPCRLEGNVFICPEEKTCHLAKQNWDRDRLLTVVIPTLAISAAFIVKCMHAAEHYQKRSLPALSQGPFAADGGECAICMETLANIKWRHLIFTCAHAPFHPQCAEQFVKSIVGAIVCPLCRAPQAMIKGEEGWMVAFGKVLIEGIKAANEAEERRILRRHFNLAGH